MVYKFPKYKKTVLSKLHVQIDQDRVVETKIVDKPASSFNLFDDKTEDVVPNSKVDEDDREKKELYRVAIGAVKPGQSVYIELHLLRSLEIVNGTYQLHIPQSYLPQTPDMNIFDFKIGYKFRFLINSSLAITDVRYPKGYTTTQNSRFEVAIEKSGNTLFFDLYGMERDAKTWMQVQFRTEDMDRPKMLF